MTTILSKSSFATCALNYTDLLSPFSQKNIQECRCGTESCRGVLGPKPKKPIEEKSIASALIAGTKRKLQDLLGAKRSGSESNQNSPKKRKMLPGPSVSTKAKNALARSESARERAEREANELSRQNASRETRALKRSSSGILDKRTRSTTSRTTQPSAVMYTKRTTVSFQRKVSRPGALKKVKKPARLQSMLSNRKALRSSQRPSTPTRETSTEVLDSEEEEDDASPNITPASLRSASKKSPLISPISRKPSTRGVRGR
jgi:palmitoyltransferase ZDHHC9/14/18